MSQLNVNTIAPQSGSSIFFDGIISGSEMRLSGDVTAQRFIVSSSVTKLITITNSGSTNFGDTQDDTHIYTGSLDITGSVTANSFSGDGTNLTNVFEGTTPSASISTRLTSFTDGTVELISGSLTSTGSFGMLQADTFEGVFSFSDGTAELISGSSTSTGSFGHVKASTFTGDVTFEAPADGREDVAKFKAVDSDANLIIGNDTGNSGRFIPTIRGYQDNASDNGLYFISEIKASADTGTKAAIDINVRRVDSSGVLINRPALRIANYTEQLMLLDNDGNITIGGNISGSSASTGSFGRVEVPAQTGGGPITLGGGSNKDLIVGDGSGTGDIVLNGNTESVLRFKTGAAATDIYMIRALSTGILTFRRNSQSRIHLDTGGQVAIGNNLTPTERLHVGGNIFATGNISGSSTSTGSFGSVIASDLTDNRIPTAGTAGQLSDSSNFTFDGSTLSVLSSDIVMSNNKTLKMKDSGGTNRSVLTKDTDDHTRLMTGTGKNIIFRVSSDNIAQVTSTHAISGSATSTGSFGYGKIDEFESVQIGTSGQGQALVVKGGDAKIWNGQTLYVNDIVSNYNANSRIGFYAGVGGVDTTLEGIVFIKGEIGGTEMWKTTATHAISGSASSTGSFGRVEATTFAGDGASLTNVPDYVYESTYVLQTIPELETFVTENKHLPNVPDMNDMDKWKTLNVGDRDMLLLEKIEELSLYIIQLNKRIENLENKQE